MLSVKLDADEAAARGPGGDGSERLPSGSRSAEPLYAGFWPILSVRFFRFLRRPLLSLRHTQTVAPHCHVVLHPSACVGELNGPVYRFDVRGSNSQSQSVCSGSQEM